MFIKLNLAEKEMKRYKVLIPLNLEEHGVEQIYVYYTQKIIQLVKIVILMRW